MCVRLSSDIFSEMPLRINKDVIYVFDGHIYYKYNGYSETCNVVLEYVFEYACLLSKLCGLYSSLLNSARVCRGTWRVSSQPVHTRRREKFGRIVRKV